MTAFDRLIARYQDLASLENAANLLGWDQSVNMPSGGATARSTAQGSLARLQHELLISDEFGKLLEDAGKDTKDEVEAATVRVLLKDRNQAMKLPTALVEKKAATVGKAYQQWKSARANNDFASMIDHYETLFEIARETSALLGGGSHPYDALIDLYEEGATHAQAQEMFHAIGPVIRKYIEIADQNQADDSFLHAEWDQPKLRDVTETVVKQVGFDFERGRLDLCGNAFCARPGGMNDIRMTTRPSGHFKGVVSSSLHEMGHALYEQNQRQDWGRLPIATGVSLAVHESQSRLWENVIGRSKPFWTYFFARYQEAFSNLASVPLDSFWRGLNKVQPGFIRVGADELTYNFHIQVRFELEVELLTETVRVKDLPDAWNAKYKTLLGITPESDSVGCLQDVHWSKGSVGYFPTYAMGNVIGLQIWEVVTQSIPDWEKQVSRGDFSAILEELSSLVYRKGCLYSPKELVRSITGYEFDPQPWVNYAESKFAEVYGRA